MYFFSPSSKFATSGSPITSSQGTLVNLKFPSIFCSRSDLRQINLDYGTWRTEQKYEYKSISIQAGPSCMWVYVLVCYLKIEAGRFWKVSVPSTRLHGTFQRATIFCPLPTPLRSICSPLFEQLKASLCNKLKVTFSTKLCVLFRKKTMQCRIKV